MQRSLRFQRALHNLAVFTAFQLSCLCTLGTIHGETPNVVGWGVRNSGTAWGIEAYGGLQGGGVIPPTLTDAIAIAGGGEHSLALRSDGTVVAWGKNDAGQSSVPANLTGVVAIAAGWKHSLAVKNDGTVVAWGWNDDGQTNVPAGLTGVVAVTAGGFHSIALKSDGTLVAWGGYGQAFGVPNRGQATIPSGLTGVKAIAAGFLHNAALKTDGTVVAWGYANWGATNVPSGLTDVVAVAVGVKHSVALKSDGTVVVWGIRGRAIDDVLDVPAGLTAKAITAGFHNVAALKTDGTVVAWGFAFDGETNVPPGLTGVEAIAAGYYHFLAKSPAPAFRLPTPAGTNVKVEAPDVDGTGNYNVSVTFDSVTSPGVTTIAAIKAVDQVKRPPAGYAHGASEVLFDVSTTATYSGVSVEVDVDRNLFPITAPALFHYELDAWKDVTEHLFEAVSKFTVANKGGGGSALSPFALFRKIDITPPVLVPTLTGTGPTNGWYRSNVSVGWTVGDPESGIASQTDCAPRTLTADSAGTTLTCSATNREGLTSSVPVTVKIDKTAPAISGMPAPGCSLWPANGKLVQVAIVTATDALSGLNTFSVTGTSNEPSNPKNPDIVITPVGGGYAVQLRADRLGTGAGRIYTLTARATDQAGNVASVTATCTAPHDKR